MICKFCWKLLPAFLTMAMGLLLTPITQSAQSKGEDEVKEAFGKLQIAVKSKEAAKIWELLDGPTQADADRSAKLVKAAYKKADDKTKAKHQDTLGLKNEEINSLDGQGLLKTKPFLAKYDEIPASKITGITVQGESATVNYLEPDGDKEKLSYSKVAGKWKVALPMPQFPK